LEVLGWVVAFFVPMAVGLIGLREHLLAKWCFAISGLVLAGRTAMWVRPLDSPWRYPLAFVAFGLIGVLVVESIRWVEKKGSEGAPDSPTPTTAAPLSPTAAPAATPTRRPAADKPAVIVEYHDRVLFIHNSGSTVIYLWGTRFEGRLVANPAGEPEMREMAPHAYYGIHENRWEQYFREKLGENGESRIPFEVLLTKSSGRQYIVDCILSARIASGNITIEVQQIKTHAKAWRTTP